MNFVPMIVNDISVNSKEKILIVGGYGKVGRIICKHLAHAYPNQVIIAGRNIQKATDLATQIQNGTRSMYLDINKPVGLELLAQVKLIIMCIDQQNTDFIELCIEKGIHYIDITAKQETLEQIENLDQKAIQHQVTVALSVGLAPGISNLLAQHSNNYLTDIDNINLFILLGLGEKHGAAAFQWTFDNIHTCYKLKSTEKTELVHSFTQPLTTTLLGQRTFYTFNFSDQHTLLKTTRAKHVKTRMAFDSKLVTSLVALFKRMGLTKILTFKKVQGILQYLFERINLGTEKYAVKVETTNPKNEKYVCQIKGLGEGKITAYVTVEMALLILQQNPPIGVKHMHQLVTDISHFFEKIKQYDNSIEVNL